MGLFGNLFDFNGDKRLAAAESAVEVAALCNL